MSGLIRVKELPTRYVIQRDNGDEYWSVYAHLTKARLVEIKKTLPFEEDVRLVTVRRWQVKRTEVTEERSKLTTFYDGPKGLVIRAWSRNEDQWIVTPEECTRLESERHRFQTREEAEAFARKWLRDNGYRLRKAPTKQGEG
jgi:predicted SPOUT superfamily RNA methylase MTH1